MANKRIANILRKSEGATSAEFDGRLLRDAAEITLASAIADREGAVRAALRRADYVAALESLAALAPQIDAFFDHVMVNDADAGLRANRHALLRRLRELFNGVADLSQLPG
jgi:glycyl-tRNA synthetase beta chain